MIFQDVPHPLTTHPVSVVLKKKNADANPSPKGKSKKTAKSAQDSSLLPRFLSTSVAEEGCGAVMMTIQSHGLYLFDMNLRQCTHSWSVPPGLMFSCAARFIPTLGTCNQAVLPSDDDEEEDHAIVSKTKKTRGGKVFAVIQSAPGMPTAHNGRQLRIWDLSDNESTLETVHTTREDSFSSVMFEHPILDLETLPHDITSYLLLVHTSGHVTVAPCDSIETPSSHGTWSPTTSNLVPVWCKNFMLSRHSVALSCKMVTVCKDASGQLFCRIHLISIDDDDISITLQKEFLISTQANFIPLLYSANVEAGKLFIANEKTLYIFNLTGESLESCLQISLSCFDIPKDSSSLLQVLSMCYVDPSYISVMGPVKRRGGEEYVMQVWDAKYGTLQTSKTVSSMQQNTNIKRCFAIGNANSTSTGPTVIMTEINVTQDTLSLIEFTTSCALLPYHAQPISLLGALGKKKWSLCQAMKSKTAQADVFIQDLCNPKKTPTTEEFEKVLERCILSRLCLETEAQKESIEKKALAQYPRVEFTHSELSLVLGRIFQVEKSDFYPKNALTYLVKSGLLSCQLQPTTEATHEKSNDKTLIDHALDHLDLHLVDLILKNVADVREEDMVKVIQFVTMQEDKKKEWGDAKYSERLEILKTFALRRNIVNLGSDMDTMSTLQKAVAATQFYFLTVVFSIPRNDHFFVRSLKENMGTHEMELIFAWAEECFKATEESEVVNPLNQWWWYNWMDKDENETSHHMKKLGKKSGLFVNSSRTAFDVVLDALSMLVDAQLALLLFTPSLYDRVEALREKINHYKSVSSLLEARLRGCMTMFNNLAIQEEKKRKKEAMLKKKEAEKSKSKGKKKVVEKLQRQRWNRMVADMTDGIGSYAIELLPIQI